MCDAVIDCTDDDDSDDAVQPRSGAGRPVARRTRPADRDDDDDDDDVLRRPNAPIALGPIFVGVSVGLLGLFILVGSLLILWITASRDADNAPAVAAADGPGAPVAIADPAPAPPRDPIGPAPDNGGAPVAGALPLQELKAATVYIKNTTANVGRATGSGFVVRSQGDTVWVVTNHHVVAPLKPEDMPGRRFPGRPRVPARPGAVELTAVFRSGTPEEQSLRAAVVADDAKNDLAVLKLSGVRDAPRPIDCKRAPKLVETMRIWAFGFPFGAELDPRKANPAITVTQGTVSSLRLDGRGELSAVQIDGDLNHGNSGGPVVDETGALVGVAVAKIEDTRIGFAVPVKMLNQLLDSRVK
jgi:S1-C subfamily serine protease